MPSLFSLRLRFFDFLVRMWRLKDFWCVILPEPVTLNLFLALELVLTFGIFALFIFTPCWRSALADSYGALWVIPHSAGNGRQSYDKN
jgi:hypothetical protein